MSGAAGTTGEARPGVGEDDVAEVPAPAVLSHFDKLNRSQLSDGNNARKLEDQDATFFQGGPFGRTFRTDPQTLNEVVTLVPKSCSQFLRPLTPELFHYDGTTIHYINLAYLKAYWKHPEVKMSASYRTVLTA